MAALLLPFTRWPMKSQWQPERSDLRRGGSLEQDADDAGHVVLVLRIVLQLYPDGRRGESLPMLLVGGQVLAAGHVNQAGHVQSGNGSPVKDRSQPDFLHDRDFAAFEHPDFVQALAFAGTQVGAQFKDVWLL